MNKAYACLALKSIDEKARKFSGIATTPSADRAGDVVEPKGAQFKLPIPLLWQHDARQPIGWVRSARVSKAGIEIEGEIADIADAGALKERLTEAWQSIKAGLVRGLSIGFTPKDAEPLNAKDPFGAQKYKVWEWLELSAVTIPANADASITAIKSAASGHSTSPRQGITTKGTTMKQYTHEALAALQNDRQTKAARMAELSELKTNEGRKFTDDERAEFEGLDSDIESLDDDIKVTRRHVTAIQRATPVDTSSSRPVGAPHLRKFKDVEPTFKGEEGLKRAVSHIISMKSLKEGNMVSPAQVFDQKFGKTNPTMLQVMKTAVPGGGTDSGEWGAELVGVDNRYTGDFVDYLYGMTTFDKLPLREVPANVGIKGQDGAHTGYFVGQSKAIKVSKGDYLSVSTTPYKAAGLTVVSNELLEDASPSALTLIGDSLKEAVAQAVDTKFLSADALSSGVSPAGILNGVSAITSNGGDAQSIITDIRALFAPFITAKNTSGGFAFIMTPTNALALSLMRNALGQPEFPTMSPQGGTFNGYPVYIGDNVGAGDVILIRTQDVWRIGDSGVRMSLSDSAMIEQDDAPTGATDTPTAASATMVSMYQEDSTAIRVVRRISWGKKYSGAVQYVGNAAWGSESS
jgi:HK97 family phage prohead protease